MKFFDDCFLKYDFKSIDNKMNNKMILNWKYNRDWEKNGVCVCVNID